MQTYLNENNLVDLISDKHAKLRKKVIEAWVQNGEEKNNRYRIVYDCYYS